MKNSESLQSITRPPSLKDIAFKTIKDSIITSKLECGFIYSENVISKKLGISKTPVHEALLELSYKGFIEILPKKGFKLKDLTRKDIDDIYAFRLALEKVVVTNAVEKVGKKQLDCLKTILLNLKSCEDVMQFMEEDIRFHRYLAMLTENQQIIISLNRIWDLCVWIGFRTLSIKNSLESVLEEHFHLLRCIEQKDQKSAEESIEKHIASSLSKIYDSGKWGAVQFPQMGVLGNIQQELRCRSNDF